MNFWLWQEALERILARTLKALLGHPLEATQRKLLLKSREKLLKKVFKIWYNSCGIFSINAGNNIRWATHPFSSQNYVCIIESEIEQTFFHLKEVITFQFHSEIKYLHILRSVETNIMCLINEPCRFEEAFSILIPSNGFCENLPNECIIKYALLRRVLNANTKKVKAYESGCLLCR